VRTGVAQGGSLLFFASMLDLINAPASAIVVGADISISPSAASLTNPRIKLIEGNSISPMTINKLRSILPSGGGLLSLASDHRRDHVLAELKLHSEFVAKQSFLIAGDSNINRHPVNWAYGPGPHEAEEPS
jgi:cephalosporin hydroxylase